MKILIDFLTVNYTVAVNRGNVIWKRGTRRADNITPDFVYNYALTMSVQTRNTTLMNELSSNKDLAVKTIEDWFRTQETNVQANNTDEELNINEFILTKFNNIFNIDDELRITLKGVVGNSYFNSVRASDVIMGVAEGELNNIPFGVERVRRTISQHLLRTRELKRNESLQKILFVKEHDKFVTRWIEKLFELYNIENNELNVIMFKHMLYSIKRAVFGYSAPDCRYMYTFFNRKQGVGKSRFIRHLCDPFLFMFTDQGTLDMLVNKNDLKALTSEKRVIDIQELACEGELDKSSYAAIKSAITSDSVGSRVLYSVENEEQPMVSVFVSSTNIHIADMIRDETGLRRFFSFDFQNKRGDMDWKGIDKHWEYIYEVYSYIDEKGNAPLNDKMPIFATLELVQEEYKRKSDFIVDWQKISGCKIHDKLIQNADKMYKTELYKLLGKYCKDYEGFTLKLGTMKNLLISRHGIHPKVDDDGIEFYYVSMPETKLKPVDKPLGIPGFDDNEDTWSKL